MENRRGFPISTKLMAAVIICLVLIAIAATSFFSVDQTESAVVLRFGKYVRTVGPGLQTKLPLGIERSYKVETAVVKTLTFGYRATDSTGTSLSGAFITPDESMMLTGDLNIVDVEWIVQYRISNPRKYLFSIKDKETTIRDISQSVMNQLVGDLPILAIMTSERTNIELEAAEAMQRIFDGYDSGIEIVAVKLQNIMPPEGEVQDAFEDVNKAIQDMNSLINEGKQYYNQEIPAAQGEADKIISEAKGYASERVNMAKGDTARFSKMLTEYEADKETTARRLYIETMEDVLSAEGGTVTLIDKSLDSYLPLQVIGGAE
ncbi:MAG: FtsH protease activity modulator HflK [Spirochaetes bacterium]|uniref:Protein HflK n=1 Tax=Candidatus Ornithospirochaeta stercoripullorum TaxID=2840899 RepID=A0A9D9DXM3_9SPIO|nr:FtsH protease activity modulator HflK [Candidatus Ornithospirochaeta stercoripullorum]